MKPKHFYFLLLGAILLSIAGSVSAFLWADKQLQHKSAQVSALIADRDVQNDGIQKLTAAKKSVSDAASISDLVNAALPKQKKQEAVVADIISIASSIPGMSADNITNFGFNGTGSPTSLSGATAVKDISGVYQYPFNLQVKDISYTNLLNFLQRIELNKRIIQVDQIQIVPDKSNAGNLSSVSLSLKTFIQP